jgi:hypothetical protein
MGHVEGLEHWGLEAFNFTKKRFFLSFGFFVFWFLSLVGFVFCLCWVLVFALG